MSEDSSERIKQLKAFASYVFLILAGAYWGYQFAGPTGAVAGAILIIPVGLFLIATMLLGIGWMMGSNREGSHGT